MRDVTDLMNKYRECSRHLWNEYFGTRENTSDLERIYEQIRVSLFKALVLADLDDGFEKPPILKVVPITSVPILIRRPCEDRNWYWDQERDMQVDREQIQLTFVDYYDYSQYPVKDFHFYRCRVSKFPGHVAYEGRDSLIEVPDARVFHGE